MKNLIISIFFLLISSSLFSQEKFGSYENKFTKEIFPITLSFDLDKSKNFTLWINASSSDDSCKYGGISLNKNQLENLIISLDSAKLKYHEWLNVAKNNNIKSMFKKMSSITCKVDANFKYVDYQFPSNIDLEFDFLVCEIENQTYYILYISTNYLYCDDDKNKSVKGYHFSFISENDIDDFIKIISMNNVNKFVNDFNIKESNKLKTKNLFK